ncbi:MAG TPA: hypothetical protein GXX29_05520, partial [Firmicutes bacterium]|nr:hypothetical protein [Bacillota bacterium]
AGSPISASPTTGSPADLGLSKVRLPDGRVELLQRVLLEHRAEIVGPSARSYGSDAGAPLYPLLVKLLDSAEQLGIQCHPDDVLAARHFSAPSGKTEAWLILNTRQIPGCDPPYILLGFKPGVTREDLAWAIEQADPKATAALLHKIPVRPGDMFIIQARVPHAIGPGIFMAEVQQPADITILADRAIGGRTVPEERCHLGIGWEKALDCFAFDGCSLEETRRRWQLQPRLLRTEPSGSEWELIGSSVSKYFCATRLGVTGSFRCPGGAAHTVLVLAGEGTVEAATAGGDSAASPWRKRIKQGDALFFPCQVPDHIYKSADPSQELRVLRCFPV